MNKHSNRIIITLFFLIGIIGFASQAQASFSWESNLVAHYKMNDNAANDTVIDSQGYSNGTAQQNTEDLTATGKVGGALSFNGSSDYVDTNDLFLSTFQNDFTISLWLKPTDGQPDGHKHIFGASIGASSIVILYHYTVGVVGTFYLGCTVDSVSLEVINTDSGFADGQETWHHVVGVIKQNTPTQAAGFLYFDGVPLASDTKDSCILANYNSYNNPHIGAHNYAGMFSGFDGDIDNVMVFNKALTSDEITGLYNEGNGIENTYAITGQVILYGGDSEVTDVLLTLSDDDTSDTTNPDTEGNYSFICWEGYDYVITPSLESCHFSPASYSYTPLDSDQTEQNFIGWLYEIHDSDGGGYSCFIATACFGTPMAEEVGILSRFRDEYLLTNPIGEVFVATYYKVSPRAALFIREHPILKKVVRNALNPLIWMSRKSIK